MDASNVLIVEENHMRDLWSRCFQSAPVLLNWHSQLFILNIITLLLAGLFCNPVWLGIRTISEHFVPHGGRAQATDR